MQKEATVLKHHGDCVLKDEHVRAEISSALKRIPKSISNLHFLPWIGKYYGKSNSKFGKRRILILGESHYEWCYKCWIEKNERQHDMTCWCIAECVTGANSITHWKKIENALNGDGIEQNERSLFWHTVAYCNYIQQIVGYKRDSERSPKPTREMYENAKEPFKKIIKSLKPDLIVVLGNTVWENLPPEDDKLKTIRRNGKILHRCLYSIDQENNSIACCVPHPAAGLGKTWNAVIEEAIKQPNNY